MNAAPALAATTTTHSPPDFAGGCRLVFVNGFFDEGRSNLEQLPAGVRLERLRRVIEREPARVQSYLDRAAAFEKDSFRALNTAFFEDGAFLCVDPGVVVAEPIHLVYLSEKMPAAYAVYPRNLLVGGAHSSVPLTETYAGSTGTYWTNRISDVHLEAGASMDHYLICREAGSACQVGALTANLDRDSRLTTHHLLFGGALVRNQIAVGLHGEGAELYINGLFMADGQQHLDTTIAVDHAAPRCTSNQYVKGMVDGNAHGVFNGSILVRQDAQKTDARQTNRNLLLSGGARVDTKPRLAIYADDVKCAHGATTGQLDEEALFYLQARGIDLESARDLLRYAFAHEILDRMSLANVKTYAERVLYDRFENARLVGGLA